MQSRFYLKIKKGNVHCVIYIVYGIQLKQCLLNIRWNQKRGESRGMLHVRGAYSKLCCFIYNNLDISLSKSLDNSTKKLIFVVFTVGSY